MDQEADSVVFPAIKEQATPLCNLGPPGGNCWLWLKSVG